ncbi:hypothetical protein [Streptomyces sp. C]|nr:hypothetical protein [Streptomyces sp. C]
MDLADLGGVYFFVCRSCADTTATTAEPAPAARTAATDNGRSASV